MKRTLPKCLKSVNKKLGGRRLIPVVEVRQSFAHAFRRAAKAAEQGYAWAQYKLAVMYAEGQGVPQDYQAALKWYRLAAMQGNAVAQSNLGILYAEGLGVL